MKTVLFTILFTVSVLFVPILLTPNQINAQAPSADDFSSWIDITLPSLDLKDGDGNITIGSIISALLPYFYGLAGFLVLLYLVLGGYQVLTSQGDPKLMATGREKITWAIVGFIILFSAYWIVQLAGRILDIQQIIDIFG